MGLRHELTILTKGNPILLQTAWRLRKPLSAMSMMAPHHGMRRIVEHDCEVVIDGYPRSANTFACDAFTVAQGHSIKNRAMDGYPIKIGNHMHAPAQFMLARKYSIPAMLVLRRPIDAALSWIVFTHGKDAAGAWLRHTQGKSAASIALQDYIRFHKPLLALRDHFIIAPFEEVIDNFGKSIARLNDKFDSKFSLFEHTGKAEKEIFDNMKDSIRLRSERFGVDLTRTLHFPEGRKHEMRNQFAREFEAGDTAQLRETANSIYEELMDSI